MNADPAFYRRMLHRLRRCQVSSYLFPHPLPSISRKKSIVLGDNELLGLKKSRRNGSLNAVEKDSEFEFDPDKAREALRKLDEQLQSLSEKQVNPPKFRVIKPSIDGPEPDQSASMFIEAQEVGPTQQLSRSTELPVGP
ncbi:hypothetical protein DH2020_027911 [Rehmannia glutinosa]|uniref:Uncharacterized protein n=1 Tax=Rehmannia glutinosa TaxID=99300 RepID=A0ABR0VWG4_REHGL